MWWEYRQNNSGGYFNIDEDNGIGVSIFVESESEEDADEKAKSIGIYFNGCAEGIDCPCCGDRWYGACNADPFDMELRKLYHWLFERGPVFLHYADGKVEKVEG